MAQVSTFVAKVLADINEAKQQIVTIEQDAGLGYLLRPETNDWSPSSLESACEKHLNGAAGTAEVSIATLKPFMQICSRRNELIHDTNGNYNSNPYSLANSAYIVLAKNLFEALKDEQKLKHYYECLFPGLHVDHYVTSKGDLGALELYEFIFSEDGTPVEILASFDKFREVFPLDAQPQMPHVCLPADMIKKGKNEKLSSEDTNRLRGHSKEAKAYYDAIMDKRSPKELDACRENLEKAIFSRKLEPKYTYDIVQSNTNLLQNGYFNALSVHDFKSFAKLLTERKIKKSDWIEYVDSVKIGNDYEILFQLLLPKVEEKQPDGTTIVFKPDKTMVLKLPDASELPIYVSMYANKNPELPVLEELKDGTQLVQLPTKNKALRKNDGSLVLQAPGKLAEFKLTDGTKVEQRPDGSIVLFKADLTVLETVNSVIAFVNAQSFPEKAEINRATMFLIATAYEKKREGTEGLYKNMPGKVTGGVVGDDRTTKTHAMHLFRQALVTILNISQWKNFFVKEKAPYLTVLGKGRSNVITDKASKLGPTLNEFSESLKKFVEQLVKKTQKAYGLELMADNTSPRSGKIYLKDTAEGLQYQVRGLDEEIKDNIIPWNKLPDDFPHHPKDSIRSRERFLPKILDHTFKAGHTLLKSDWKSWMRRPIMVGQLSNFIDTSTDLADYIAAQEYSADDSEYTRALLYTLAEYYRGKRSSEPDKYSIFGYSFSQSKCPAIEAFLAFLASDWPLNDFRGYLTVPDTVPQGYNAYLAKSNQKAMFTPDQVMDIMRDKSARASTTRALMTKMEEFFPPLHPEPVQKTWRQTLTFGYG